MANPADILRNWCDETDRVTRKQVADWMDCSVSTVSRLISGESRLTLEQWLSLASPPPPTTPPAPMALILDVGAALHRRTRVSVGEAERPSLADQDVTGDGHVRADDAEIRAARTICSASDLARDLLERGRPAEALVQARGIEHEARLLVATLETVVQAGPSGSMRVA